MKQAIFVFLVLVIGRCLYAQPGSLITTFGDSGITRFDYNKRENITEDILLQPDGKILLTGYSDVAGQITTLIRVTPEGRLDSSFGTNGFVFHDGETHSHNQRLTLQPDGKILVAADDAAHPIMLRWHPDGKPDSSFGINGRLGEFFASDHGLFHRACLMADSSILAPGSIGHYVNSEWDYDIAVRKITKFGKVDSSYCDKGTSYYNVYGKSDYAEDALLHQGKRIIIGGSYGTSEDRVPTLIGFKLDGTIDSSFGKNGRASLNVSDTTEWLYSMSSQRNGKILGAVDWDLGRKYQPAVIRFNADGSPDSTFGVGGIVKFLDTAVTWGIFNIREDSSGRIIGAGIQSDGTNGRMMIMRLLHDGTPDSSFGTNGFAFYDNTPHGERGASIAVLPDGNYILGGYANFGNGLDWDFMVLKINAEPKSAVERTTLHNEDDIRVIPNPASEAVTLTYKLPISAECSITLTNTLGKQVRTFTTNQYRTAGEHKEELDLRGLAAGVYFLQVESNSSIQTAKLIKQ
jgi:uncharacterized delta-60 repeat protein